MNIWGFLKNLKPKSLWNLIRLCCTHLWMVWPTLTATNHCIEISNKNYAKLHHKNNPANAFRHAMWNYMISKHCFKWVKNEQKVTNWAKKITDWHETFSANHDMARTMDIHNNAVGRNLFIKYKNHSDEKITAHMKFMVQHSRKVTELNDFKNVALGQLTHIVDF